MKDEAAVVFKDRWPPWKPAPTTLTASS